MRHSVIIGACQETLPKLRRGDIEEAGGAEPKSRELQGCIFEQYCPHAPPDEQSPFWRVCPRTLLKWARPSMALRAFSTPSQKLDQVARHRDSKQKDQPPAGLRPFVGVHASVWYPRVREESTRRSAPDFLPRRTTRSRLGPERIFLFGQRAANH